MRAPLEDLSPELLEKVLDIEIIIIPILEKVGIFITRAGIKNEMMRDPTQIVILSFKGTEIAALLRYSRLDSHLFIKSIALNPEFGAGAFQRLIHDALPAIQEETVDLIESVVQVSNLRSISMHEKLGFHKIHENSKSIRYGINRIILIDNFKSKYRRK